MYASVVRDINRSGDTCFTQLLSTFSTNINPRIFILHLHVLLLFPLPFRPKADPLPHNTNIPSYRMAPMRSASRPPIGHVRGEPLCTQHN